MEGHGESVHRLHLQHRDRLKDLSAGAHRATGWTGSGIPEARAGVEVPIAIAQFPDVLRPARTPLLIATRTAATGTDTRMCRLITGTETGTTRVSKTRETTTALIRRATVATVPVIAATTGATGQKRNIRACIARASVRDMKKPTARDTTSTIRIRDRAAVGGRGRSNLLGHDARLGAMRRKSARTVGSSGSGTEAKQQIEGTGLAHSRR